MRLKRKEVSIIRLLQRAIRFSKKKKKKDINNETCINNCNGEALSGKTNYKSDRFAIPLMAGKSQF